MSAAHKITARGYLITATPKYLRSPVCVAGEWGRRMIPKDCKGLAEMDFPIAEVSTHKVRKKSIRPGHPSTSALKAETP